MEKLEDRRGIWGLGRPQGSTHFLDSSRDVLNEQFAKVVGKHLAFLDPGIPAKLFHLPPDIAAIK